MPCSGISFVDFEHEFVCFCSVPYLRSIQITNLYNKLLFQQYKEIINIPNSNRRMLQFNFFLFSISFITCSNQILFFLHSIFHAEVSQSVCKPNQISEFCVILMIQKVSNCFLNLELKGTIMQIADTLETLKI